MTLRWIWPLFGLLAWLWAMALPGAAMAAAADSGAPLRAGSALVYVAGGALCHQRVDRSFHLAGIPFPVCARCTGVYWGIAAMVLGLAWVRPVASRTIPSPRSQHTLRRWMLLALAMNGGTLAYEWMDGRVPGNGLRAAAGAVLGAVTAGIVWHATRPSWHSE